MSATSQSGSKPCSIAADSGCALGKRLQHYFSVMRAEAHGADSDEDRSRDSPFKLGPAGAGVVRQHVLLRPQHAFTESRENVRVRAVYQELQAKTACRGVRVGRDETAFLSVSRASSVFVGVSATPMTRMDNVTYRECWSSYLGGSSPVCAQWVGKTFSHYNGKKRTVIDKYGDTVTYTTLKGDHYLIRHDNFKWTLDEQAVWCRFEIHTEPIHNILPFITQRSSFLRVKHHKKQDWCQNSSTSATSGSWTSKP